MQWLDDSDVSGRNGGGNVGLSARLTPLEMAVRRAGAARSCSGGNPDPAPFGWRRPFLAGLYSGVGPTAAAAATP